MSWNIDRDSTMENIDFERDVSEFRLVESLLVNNEDAPCSEPDDLDGHGGTSTEMNAHLEALIRAAVERENEAA